MDSIAQFLRSLPEHPKRIAICLGILLAVAAFPRLYLLGTVSKSDFLHNDGHEYMEISRQLAAGNGFSLSFYRWYEFPAPGQKDLLHTDLSRTPLFPLIGTAAFLIPGDPLFWMKGISFLLAMTAIFCVFLIGREFGGELCGLFSAALFAFYPYSFYYAASWSTENLFLILLALASLFLMKACKGKLNLFPYCGLFLALATLTRPTAVLLPFVFIPMLFFFIRPIQKWRELGRPVLLFSGIFLLLLLPWTIRNYKVGGSFTPLTYYGSYVFWLSSSDIIYETYRTMDTPEYTKVTDEVWNRLHTERLAELKQKGVSDFIKASQYWKKWGLEYIRDNPDKMAYILKERFFHYWRMCPNMVVMTPLQILLFRIYFTAVFGLALAGLLLLRKRKESLLLLLLPFFGLAISIPFLLVLRYRYPFFAPYVCVFAAFSLTWLTMKMTGGKSPELPTAGKRP